MDADWLNRAGILAEAVAFVLIAPEIIGSERLRRAESAIEDFIEWLAPYLWGRRYPNRPYDVINFLAAIVLTGLAFTGTFLLSLYVRDTLPWIMWTTAALLAVYAIAATYQIIDALYILLSPRRPRLSLAAYRTLHLWRLLIGVPTKFVGLLAGFVLFYLVSFALEWAVRLLAGENRLRIFVFSTGVLLLFGGMTAQFAATF